MSTKDRPKPLSELLAMPLDQRIAAVAKDVRSKRDRYASIDSFDLASALGVEQPEQPAEWIFTHYAKKQTLEQYAHGRSPVSEFLNYLRDHVSEERFEELTPKFDRLDSLRRPRFGFLTKGERLIIEEALDAEELEANMSNGICCVASCSVGEGGNVLFFEGDIEDDGTCITLRTPYDQREGKFIDLSNCVTDDFL